MLVTAGCTGLGLTDASTRPPDGQDLQPTPPPTPPSQSATVTPAKPAARSTPGPADSVRRKGYTKLYTQTIDSVVEITVRTPRGQSQGSGFVYNEAGYIVTNQHVVGEADRVQVRFRTGAWRTARVVGTDVYTDLAVVKVESFPAGVDPLPVARSDPRPGQPVVALGSPLGYEGSITHGIVSGVNRSMRTARGFSIPDTIQTDAPINPGNSGGPLVSLNGTVLGVNRAKKGDNLGFAISADVVRRVVPRLIETGSYHHSFMGIQTAQVTPLIAEVNDLPAARGVMVVRVLEDGPSAGSLQPAALARTESGATVPVGGDVIVSVDGHTIRSQQALAQYLLLQTTPGETISVTALRDGERVTETITLGRRPELRADSPV